MGREGESADGAGCGADAAGGGGACGAGGGARLGARGAASGRPRSGEDARLIMLRKAEAGGGWVRRALVPGDEPGLDGGGGGGCVCRAGGGVSRAFGEIGAASASTVVSAGGRAACGPVSERRSRAIALGAAGAVAVRGRLGGGAPGALSAPWGIVSRAVDAVDCAA